MGILDKIKDKIQKGAGKSSTDVASISTYRDFLLALGQVCCTKVSASRLADESYFHSLGLGIPNADTPEFAALLAKVVPFQVHRLKEDGYIASILNKMSEDLDVAKVHGSEVNVAACATILNLTSISFVRYLMKIHPEFVQEAKKMEPIIRNSLGQLEPVHKELHFDLTSTNNKKATELFIAAYNNDLSTLNQLLKRGADPNRPSFCDLAEEEILDSDIPNEIGAYYLQQIMIKRRHPEAFHQMDLGIHNLYYPSREGYDEIVHALLEAGADPNARSFSGMFPLYVAAEMGHLYIVKDLIDHGADVNQVTPKNCTAVLNAAEEGHLEIVRYLLTVGADPYIENQFGFNAETAAIRYEHYDIANLIRSQNSMHEVESYADNKSNMLAKGILCNDLKSIAALIESGVNVNQRGKHAGKIITPIVEASVQRNHELVRMLLNAGADPNIAQENRETSLANAAQNGDYMIALDLLEAGADPNAVTLAGTPLAVASNIAIMQLLHSHGADPNLADVDNDIPIVGSMVARDYEAVYFLRLIGSDLNTVNRNGLTPIGIAEKMKDRELSCSVFDDPYESVLPSIEISGLRNEIELRIEKLKNNEYPARVFMREDILAENESFSQKQIELREQYVGYVNKAVALKREGDIQAANDWYKKVFKSNSVLDSSFLWGWVKVLLLAKNFRDARLMMRYFSAVSARVNFFYEERTDLCLDHISSSARSFDFDGFTAFMEYTNTYPMEKAEVEDKIRRFGGSSYWDTYSLSTNEYDMFLRNFGIDDFYIERGIDV